MLRSLLSRNIAIMAIIVVLSQIMTVALFSWFVVRPQANRMAGVLARSIGVVSTTIATLPPDQKTAMIARINAGDGLRIRPGNAPPLETGSQASFLEQQVLRELARNLGTRDEIDWRGGGAAPLWVKLDLGGRPYWVSVDTPGGWAPDGTLVGSFAFGLACALVAGMLLQRRINRPLKHLAAAVDAMPREASKLSLADDGPAEVAAVARSFNAMTARLAAQDSDRAIMLAGISHDLKTPLAKIRLALAVDPSNDPEIAALLDRQLNRMERMLDQFLDFGRGMDSEPIETLCARRSIEAAIGAVGAEHSISIAASAAIMLRVRPMAFERTIVNLLRNALVHGAPPINVAITRDDGWVQIAVADRGPGVPGEALDRLVQPFVRAEVSRPSDGSVGLGLAIAARFARDHGGSLALANRKDGGFEATLSLPEA